MSKSKSKSKSKSITDALLVLPFRDMTEHHSKDCVIQ